MTSITEHDREQLEQWLDGELGDEQAEVLRRRLSGEPHLAHELDRLRSDRELRARFWQELDPSDAQVETVTAAVRRAVLKEEVWSGRFRSLRKVSGIAESIAVVFMAGWMSRGKLHVGPGADSRVQPPGTFTIGVGDMDTSRFGLLPAYNNSGIMPVSNPAATVRPAQPDAYQVYVVDARGQIIASQQLDQLQDPHQFTAELSRWQLRQPQPTSRTGSAGGRDSVFVNDQR